MSSFTGSSMRSSFQPCLPTESSHVTSAIFPVGSAKYPKLHSTHRNRLPSLYLLRPIVLKVRPAVIATKRKPHPGMAFAPTTPCMLPFLWPPLHPVISELRTVWLRSHAAPYSVYRGLLVVFLSGFGLYAPCPTTRSSGFLEPISLFFRLTLGLPTPPPVGPGATGRAHFPPACHRLLTCVAKVCCIIGVLHGLYLRVCCILCWTLCCIPAPCKPRCPHLRLPPPPRRLFLPRT